MKSLAYHVDSQKLSIDFLGDTEPCESVTKLVDGADILVANSWDHQGTSEENGETPGQTGTLDSAKMAEEPGVQMPILNHTGLSLSKPGSKEKGIADMARIFQGEIIFGGELVEISLQ